VARPRGEFRRYHPIELSGAQQVALEIEELVDSLHVGVSINEQNESQG